MKSIWKKVLGLTLLTDLAFALPQLDNVEQGAVTVNTSGPALEITATDKSIINWKSFSIDSHEVARFVQPTPSSVVLNQVTGPLKSEILGQLQANGKVYLINPQGILIGKDAVIHTASFIGSTLPVVKSDFSAGKELHFKGISEESIVHLGTLSTSSGPVALLAHRIENQGKIETQGGSQILATGHEILLSPEADSLIYIKPDLKGGDIETSGILKTLQSQDPYTLTTPTETLSIQQEGGKVYLVSGGRTKISGSIEADSIEVKGDGIYLAQDGALKAPEGQITIEGRGQTRDVHLIGEINVSGKQAGAISILSERILQQGKILADSTEGTGGTIKMDARGGYIATGYSSTSANGPLGQGKIDVHSSHLFTSGSYIANEGMIYLFGENTTLAAASINVDGAERAGVVLIGGNTHGFNSPYTNSKTIFVNHATRITANASQGNGGKVIIWSDESTHFVGHVQANGGQQAKGGFIEVSGKELKAGGSALASAHAGFAGVVLFDPQDIIISESAGVYPQYELIDPSNLGSGFGSNIALCPSGNVLVTKPNDGLNNEGAVYFYSGLTGSLLTVLQGSHSNDLIGSDGVQVLQNGNFVVFSSFWNSSLGAVTWGNGTSGIAGIVDSTNSFVGSTAGSFVGSNRGVNLPNGNYVVLSNSWSDGTHSSVGAVTWGNGTNGQFSTGGFGAVSSLNSIVGSHNNDFVGNGGITILPNDNYVINSSSWANGGTAQAGAVTLVDGATGQFKTGGFGTISNLNSLVGSHTNDRVGLDGITILSAYNNYVVVTSQWNHGAGAVTWGDGTNGTVGVVGSSNSFIGNITPDQVGSGGVVVLTNGNYVVASPAWTDPSGPTSSVGAVTWGNGLNGTLGTGGFGAVSSSNSFVGSQANDQVGIGGVTALTNGNYVVSSFLWSNGGSTNAGAVTWGNGTTGKLTTGGFGPISTADSFVGSLTNDRMGGLITALSNGNYAIGSSPWNGARGAVTWGNGSNGHFTGGGIGALSSSNSLVGSTPNDGVGGNGAQALPNGHFVVRNELWDNGANSEAGAVTWCNGQTGSTTGSITSSNSLVGTHANDHVGDILIILTNGNYVTSSGQWNSSTGAATWGNKNGGTVGPISSANSYIGSAAGDSVGGNQGLVALTNGNYVVLSPRWNNDRGAVTWGDGTSGSVGLVSGANSFVGSTLSDQVGSAGSVTPLANGNYVVLSPPWSDPDTLIANVGAITWGNGTNGEFYTGGFGPISSSNSLVGSSDSDFVGDAGVTLLSSGDYLVISDSWGSGSGLGAVTWGNQDSGQSIVGEYGTITPQNSVTGEQSSFFISSVLDDSTDGAFISYFPSDGSGRIRVGIYDPNQMTYARAQAQTMTITTDFLTHTLNTGTDVVLQANNDITLSTPLVISNSGSGGSLTLAAGKSIDIQANITTDNGDLTLIGNDLLSNGVVDAYRTAGDATITIGNSVQINVGQGNLLINLRDGAGKTESSSGNIIIGDSVQLTATGSGTVTLQADVNNIQIGTGATVSTQHGDLLLIAGTDMTSLGASTLQTTGTGALTLVVDELYPTSPDIGSGVFNISDLTLTTNGGNLRLYAGAIDGETFPAQINGVPYAFGDGNDSFGVYYPQGTGGVPFHVYYKSLPPTPPSPIPTPHSLKPNASIRELQTDISNIFSAWQYLPLGPFLSDDSYPPSDTPKGMNFTLPFLIHDETPLLTIKNAFQLLEDKKWSERWRKTKAK